MADERIGRVQNVAAASVVLLQFDLVFDLEFSDEIGHIAHPRAAKSVDALVVVAHRHHTAAGQVAGTATQAGRGKLALPSQHLDPRVLQFVGVLKLVDQDVPKAALVMLADRHMVAQQFIRAQHQLAKIDHPFTLALVFIKLVDLDFFARV